ncbi:hypothetical protein BT96DRAFT_912999 [Gymnopus androsaceus JB14]|uniref:DUF4050 domain-containing protein n=1 Tax=Gymnopus androsaceus JB14 TaxID=1447944 RepID=A0A6A4IHN6_9AGAR|nr:hypothetical protein BT96DRAFT_912999 [Gymnopus androsaceus JB14]
MNNEPDSDSFSNSSQHSFEQLLKASDSQLPPPGPAYYLARRALWLKSPDNFVPHDDSVPRQLSTSRQKLENLLHTSDAVYNKEAWEGGIEKVFKGLSGGATLKRRLPLNLVIKIVHCAWVQDGTWPAGAVAPEPDDVAEEVERD